MAVCATCECWVWPHVHCTILACTDTLLCVYSKHRMHYSTTWRAKNSLLTI